MDPGEVPVWSLLQTMISRTNLTPIALRLVEAVGVLHEHNVAHHDINLRKGFAGTLGCVAPEVEKEDLAYSPVRADRWAVGNVITNICKICGPGPSPQGEFLEHLSSLLMAGDPSSRLSKQKRFELIDRSEQNLSEQQAVNVTAKSMDGGNNQPLVVVM